MYYYIIRNVKNKLVYVGYTKSSLSVRWGHHNHNKDTTSREIIGVYPNVTIQVLEESTDGGVTEMEWFDKVEKMGYTLVNRRDNKKYKKNKIVSKIHFELNHFKYYFNGIESKNY